MYTVSWAYVGTRAPGAYFSGQTTGYIDRISSGSSRRLQTSYTSYRRRNLRLKYALPAMRQLAPNCGGLAPREQNCPR